MANLQRRVRLIVLTATLLGILCVVYNPTGAITVEQSTGPIAIVSHSSPTSRVTYNTSTKIKQTANLYLPLAKKNPESEAKFCPVGLECSSLGGDCLKCDFNTSCIYGEDVNVTCHPKAGVDCTGSRDFQRTMNCRYCYQSDEKYYKCVKSSQCKVVASPRQRYIANCTVNSNVICMGSRTFQRNHLCNWTSGYKWSTALLLSICLGGFGADRFYLGHWQEGIGKLFSFGGLGVWTLVDVILIGTGYLGPADRSLYL